MNKPLSRIQRLALQHDADMPNSFDNIQAATTWLTAHGYQSNDQGVWRKSDTRQRIKLSITDNGVVFIIISRPQARLY